MDTCSTCGNKSRYTSCKIIHGKVKYYVICASCSEVGPDADNADEAVMLWKEADSKVIDGVVNGTAGFVERLSAVIRKIETGYVQNYALGILIGVAVITGYYLGR